MSKNAIIESHYYNIIIISYKLWIKIALVWGKSRKKEIKLKDRLKYTTQELLKRKTN